MQQIRAAHDADQLAVAHDRDAFDAMAFQERRDLLQRGVLGYRHHLSCHHLARAQAVRAHQDEPNVPKCSRTSTPAPR